MNFEDSIKKFSAMSEKEKGEFARLANYLMSSTYLLRDDINHRVSRDYLFVERKFDLFSFCLEMIGWKIFKDSQYGVIYTYNDYDMNVRKLDKLTTVILITIRLIYEEKRVQASSSNDVFTTVSEVMGKIMNDFSVYKKVPTKRDRRDSFRILEYHNLIYKLDGSFEEYECRIKILPSVLFAVSNEKCKAVCDLLTLEKGEENEETEQTASD